MAASRVWYENPNGSEASLQLFHDAVPRFPVEQFENKRTSSLEKHGGETIRAPGQSANVVVIVFRLTGAIRRHVAHHDVDASWRWNDDAARFLKTVVVGGSLEMIDEFSMLIKDACDAILRRRGEDVGVGEKRGARERQNGGQIETNDETRFRTRLKIGDLRLVETDRRFVEVEQLSNRVSLELGRTPETLDSDLRPRSWSCSTIENDLPGMENVEFLVYFQQLERTASAIVELASSLDVRVTMLHFQP